MLPRRNLEAIAAVGVNLRPFSFGGSVEPLSWSAHRAPTQSVCVADCYFIVNVLDLPFASPIAIYR